MLARATRATRLSARQADILERARAQGEVLVEPLALRFEVTPQTIRRDLAYLCQLRLLQRTHGGAVVSDGVSNMVYAARKRLAVEEKDRIGQRAAALIPNDASVFVNIGTTTEQVAHHLAHHSGMLVITNNVNVVEILRLSGDVQLMTAGGTVRHEDGGIVGDETAEFFSRFKVDFAVIGVSAIEDDGTLLDFDPREVRVAKAIIANARSVILVADSGKFERSAPVRICNISEIDHFVTDSRPPTTFLEVCREHGVSVEIAPAPARHAKAGERRRT
jgi:DeoR family glycerol-3-phosphate regulon repressor